MPVPDIAVVIPHFQRKPGLLAAAVQSAFSQTIAERIVVIVCDDESPSPAHEELSKLAPVPREQLIVIQRPNGGAGAARNTALDAIPAGVHYVAFLDSDDAWRPHHLAHAVKTLEAGYDAYFCNFIGVGFPDIGHFERIGSLKPEDHPVIDETSHAHELAVSALDHTVSDGGGLIGTPTVVYRFDRYQSLRFREEFYNGQDFFFWMDLSELGARFAFSFDIGCDNGTGVNIYQASGWASEKSLQRVRNELFVWTSVERFYALDSRLLRANKKTIRELQRSVASDLLHRLRHRKPIALRLLADIVGLAPSSLVVTPLAMLRILTSRASRR
jgi:succinoglycan biosynthesis protein ExoW